MPVLHVPDEPTVRAEGWLAAVLDGVELDRVLADENDGVTAWFWNRWRSLASSGLNEEGLRTDRAGLPAELWLWLAGERTWAQCCSGLIGRINRRLAGGGDGTTV